MCARRSAESRLGDARGPTRGTARRFAPTWAPQDRDRISLGSLPALSLYYNGTTLVLWFRWCPHTTPTLHYNLMGHHSSALLILRKC